MTAPATAPPSGVSPAPIVPAPVAPATPDFDAMTDPMARTIAQTMHESRELLAEDQPITDRPRDPKTGKFVTRAEGAAEGWQVIGDGKPPEGEVPPEIVVPEGHVIPKTLDAAKVQGFRVLDAEGELVPPDLKFEITFRGNTPRVVDIPQLVNYARQGIYNHEREQQSLAVTQQNAQLNTQVSQYNQALKQLQDERAMLLSDPDYLLRALAEHEAQNTPQAKAQRDRQQLELERQALAYQAAGQENERYMEQRLEPALNTLAEAYPNVTLQDLAEQLVRLAVPYTVQTPYGNIIHPQAHPYIAQLVVNQLAPWAEQRHMELEDRIASRGSARAPASAPVAVVPAPGPGTPAVPASPSAAELQARAQRARRLGTSAIKPPGGNGAFQAPNAPATPPTSTRDLQDFVVGRALAQTRGG